jgi:hypothetical protein
MLYNSKKLPLFIIPFIFLAIYWQLFVADYAYLDEIHELWNNKDDSNFIMFHTQGRWLTGLLHRRFFASISSIEELKWIRLFSLAGWILTTIVWATIFRKWIKIMQLPETLYWPSILFVACCTPVIVYIGWASCFQVWLAALAGLLSGHLIYSKLYDQKGPIHISNFILLGSLLLGVASLFIYQAAFGIFLLPFFLHYMQNRNLKPSRVIVIGFIFYLVVYLVYYLLFKQSLKAYHIDANTRTAIGLDPLKKISFFISKPLQQAFGINLLFSPRNIFLQILCPLMAAVTVYSIFKRNRDQPVLQTTGYLGILIFLLAMIYLPLMIAAESFDSYRTLFAFNLAVFILVADSLWYLFSRLIKPKVFIAALVVWLLATGFYTFNLQYLRPLKAEYKALHGFVKTNYTPGIQQVDFIRADKKLFARRYHMDVYRDEFGVPSTCRDWVPEPISKQLIYELSGDRNLAQRIIVNHYEADSVHLHPTSKDKRILLIDMNRIFR